MGMKPGEGRGGYENGGCVARAKWERTMEAVCVGEEHIHCAIRPPIYVFIPRMASPVYSARVNIDAGCGGNFSRGARLHHLRLLTLHVVFMNPAVRSCALMEEAAVVSVHDPGRLVLHANELRTGR